MKQTIATLVLVLALAGLSFAHGGAQHVMGTVTAVAADSITLRTANGAVQAVAYNGQTRFLKSGAPASAKDLRTGDRVVIEAEKRNGKMQAESVRFGQAARGATMPPMAGMKH